MNFPVEPYIRCFPNQLLCSGRASEIRGLEILEVKSRGPSRVGSQRVTFKRHFSNFPPQTKRASFPALRFPESAKQILGRRNDHR